MHPAALPLALGTLGAIAGLPDAFRLWLEPAVPVVPLGGSLRLRLRTDCREPSSSSSSSGTVETPLEVRRLPAPPGEVALELLNVTAQGTALQAVYRCGADVELLPVTILAYSAPQTPVLEPVPVPPLAVGEELEVLCRVAGAVPIRNLTVVLSCGPRVLRSQRFPQGAEAQPGTVELRHRLRAQRWHHGHHLSCQALLDLAPHGPSLNATSEPQLVTVYELPADPRLGPGLQLEVGELGTSSCSAPEAFPVPSFQLTLANRSLPLAISPDGHRATAQVSHDRPGRFPLVCSVGVGPRRRHAEVTVQVYSFPPPRLQLSTSSPAAGTVVSGHCSVPSNYSSEVQVRAGQRVLAGWAQPPLAFSLLAEEEEDGTELSCHAKVPIAGKAPKRSLPVRLSVAVKPRLDDSSCPPRQNWTEGQDETLRCWARGRPRPRLECAKDGGAFPAGVALPASRAHAGIYRCRASNLLGTAERNITVWVQYHDPDVALPALLALAVAAAAAAAAGVSYGVYYRKKKIRQYRLRRRQRRMETAPGAPPGGRTGSPPGSRTGKPPGAAPGTPPGAAPGNPPGGPGTTLNGLSAP